MEAFYEIRPKFEAHLTLFNEIMTLKPEYDKSKLDELISLFNDLNIDVTSIYRLVSQGLEYNHKAIRGYWYLFKTICDNSSIKPSVFSLRGYL